ncbi:MAG: lipopolysaccharide biosynthesis protein [Bacteroidota bacterium]|jgi:O-antigen/teichoic acid export membrane protein|nr:hypothetical protein [Sphingobacteriales bacterium]
MPGFLESKLNRFNSLQTFQFLRYGAILLISVLLAKITHYAYDSPGYGLLIISRYELLLLVSSSLTFFWVSSICNTLIPFYNGSDEDQQKHILFNAFVILVVLSSVGAIAMFTFGSIKYSENDLFHTKDLFHTFSLVVFLNTPTYIADYILYLKGKYKSLIIWGVVTFGLQVVLLCMPLLMGQTLNLAINLWVILSLLKFNYTIILLMKYSIISVHTRLILDFMKRVMPFMFSILLAGSMEYISSYIVQHYYTEAEFVIFRYGAKELPVFLILANSLSNVFSGEIAKLNQEGKLEEGVRKLKHSSTKLMRRTFPATMILMLVSPLLFRYMYSEQFVEGYKVFNIYLLLIISRMIFPQTVIMGIMKNRIFYVISFNYIIINVLLSFWFMYLFGIYGIAYATALAFLAEKIMYAIYCKMEGIRFREYTALYEHLFFSILTIIVYFASMWLWNAYPLVS